MSIENRQELNNTLNETMAWMNLIISQADMSDAEDIEKIAKSIKERGEIIRSEGRSESISVSADPNKNVI